MLRIETTNGELVGTLRLDGRRLIGSTPQAREFAAAAIRRWGSARDAYRALPGTSDGWTSVP